jgi:hypothetical protein
MNFFMFHLMPWPHLLESYDGPALGVAATSSTIALSTSSCARKHSASTACASNEHHANAYGNMPSPNLIASILARQTRRVRIAVVGNERWRDLILNATLRVPGKLRPDRVPDPFAAAVLEFLTA